MALQIQRVRELIGKPVQVKLADGSRVSGILHMAGWNAPLQRMQITIGRLPIPHPQFRWKDIQPHPDWDAYTRDPFA